MDTAVTERSRLRTQLSPIRCGPSACGDKQKERTMPNRGMLRLHTAQGLGGMLHVWPFSIHVKTTRQTGRDPERVVRRESRHKQPAAASTAKWRLRRTVVNIAVASGRKCLRCPPSLLTVAARRHYSVASLPLAHKPLA